MQDNQDKETSSDEVQAEKERTQKNPRGTEIFRNHTASCTMGTGSLSPGYSGRGVALTSHPILAPRLKKETSYTSTPPLDHHGLF